MGRQFLPGHGTGHHHVLVDLGIPGETRQRRSVCSPADQQKRGSGYPAAPGRQGFDQHVLPLAPNQPAHAHDNRTIGQAVALADVVAARPRPEELRVDTAGQPGQGRMAAKGRRKAHLGVVGEIGHSVDRPPDPAQHLTGAWQRRPAHLMAVRARDDPAHPQITAQPRREQAQRRGGPEPHRIAAV